MYKLSLLGWTQEEIGKMFEMKQEAVSQNISKLKEFNSLIISDFYDKRKPVEEIAKCYNLDMPFYGLFSLKVKMTKSARVSKIRADTDLRANKIR